jgi:hypothetical protein
LDADETRPQTVLTGDRNVTGAAGAAVGGSPTRDWTDPAPGGIPSNPSPAVDASWDTAVHNRVGNIGLGDGSAHQVTEANLKKQIQSSMQGGTAKNRLQLPK